MTGDGKKKPSLAMVIAGDDKDDDEGAPSSKSTDEGEDYSASVDELFDALKSGDREAFSDAFKAAVMSCK